MSAPTDRDEATEIDLLVARYLEAAQGNAVAALRAAVADALREAVDARLAILDLQRAASAGYLRQRPARADAEESPPRRGRAG